MDIKMVSEFMVTRFSILPARGRVRPASLVVVALSFAVVAVVGCQKVPLVAPTGSTITLTSSATTLPINGTTSLIVQVVEQSGTAPQENTTVLFTTTLGTIQP